MSGPANSQDDLITIEVIFDADIDAAFARLVAETTGARLLSFEPPVGRLAVPTNRQDEYALLFTILPYARLADKDMKQRARVLWRELDRRQRVDPNQKYIDPNTLIVRFQDPSTETLQAFEKVYAVSTPHFATPFSFTQLKIPKQRAWIYYTLLRLSPHVVAVDFNTISGIF